MGKFVVFEGIDGSGKTSIIRALAEDYRERGLRVLVECEPTHSPIGELIREALRGERRFDPLTLAFLFLADRHQHIQGVLSRGLSKYDLVFCDRYKWSTLAYQSSSSWERGRLYSYQSWVLHPDLAIYLDVEPEEGLRRIRGGASVMERLPKLVEAREHYLYYVELGELVRVPTTKRSMADVFRDCSRLVDSIL